MSFLPTIKGLAEIYQCRPRFAETSDIRLHCKGWEGAKTSYNFLAELPNEYFFIKLNSPTAGQRLSRISNYFCVSPPNPASATTLKFKHLLKIVS